MIEKRGVPSTESQVRSRKHGVPSTESQARSPKHGVPSAESQARSPKRGVPSFHKGGVRGGSCNLTDPQPPNLGGSRTDPQPPNLGGLGGVRGGSCNQPYSLFTMNYSLFTIKVTRTTPNPSFMKGGDHRWSQLSTMNYEL